MLSMSGGQKENKKGDWGIGDLILKGFRNAKGIRGHFVSFP